MSDRASRALSSLEALRVDFRRGVARKKLALLNDLAASSLADADEVTRLHDLMALMRAYPDNRAVLSAVESILASFANRDDVSQQRFELVNSGIAGTDVEFPFYWFTLCWLVANWPDRVHIDWPALTGKRREMLDRRLSMLMPYCETLALEEAPLTTREWIDRLKGPDETDATFLVRRFQAFRADPLPREAIFEENDVPFRIASGPDTPSMTELGHSPAPRFFQGTRPMVLTRGRFREKIDRPPKSVRSVPVREARRLIDMARVMMVSRSRDLDCFVHGDERDVRMIDYPEGLQFVAIGTRPERRQLIDAAYGFLMLRNGVPLGYVLSASLFESTEFAYNVSPAFRGTEAAHVYARALSMVRHLFAVDTIMVDPYQMGHGNPEGLRSGAWWFYYKLGFRPQDPTIARMAEAEQEKVRGKRGYRTSIAKLERLSSVNMYLHLAEPRNRIIGEFARENVGLHIAQHLATRFGSDRERGIETCAREAARLTGLGSLRDLDPGERLAWDRLAPLVTLIPGIEDWPENDRKAVGRVVRAKGGRRESDFTKRFDAHRRLRDAVWRLSEAPPDAGEGD